MTKKNKKGDAGGCRQTYRPERPKGAKDEVKRPFLPFLPILHCRGAKPAAAKPAAAKPAASNADYSRPRQTIADQGRLQQTKADHCRPKYSEIRGATSIFDAFIVLHATCWTVPPTSQDVLVDNVIKVS